MKHLPVYLDAANWSTDLNVEIKTVDPNALPDAITGARPTIKVVAKKTHVFDANLQKQLLSKHNLEFKVEQQEWAKHIANKKVVMTLISRQCDNATLTELALRTTYGVNCNKENLIKFHNRLKAYMLRK